MCKKLSFASNSTQNSSNSQFLQAVIRPIKRIDDVLNHMRSFGDIDFNVAPLSAD